ncbi:hypothetical protein SDC9_161150 [bioreactor metagenome]|uniref:Uncharacterized protein n=1 Tax=bioreactor metagenome TaxID=1076179 RepID=A0A645FNC5_9ZZZZ
MSGPDQGFRNLIIDSRVYDNVPDHPRPVFDKAFRIFGSLRHRRHDGIKSFRLKAFLEIIGFLCKDFSIGTDRESNDADKIARPSAQIARVDIRDIIQIPDELKYDIPFFRQYVRVVVDHAADRPY